MVTGCLEAVQALLRAGASIMVKSGALRCAWRARCAACTHAHPACPPSLLANASTETATAHCIPPSTPFCPPPPTGRAVPCRATLFCADGEAYIGEDFLVPGSTPLHIAVIVTNAPIVHALLQVLQYRCTVARGYCNALPAAAAPAGAAGHATLLELANPCPPLPTLTSSLPPCPPHPSPPQPPPFHPLAGPP